MQAGDKEPIVESQCYQASKYSTKQVDYMHIAKEYPTSTFKHNPAKY